MKRQWPLVVAAVACLPPARPAAAQTVLDRVLGQLTQTQGAIPAGGIFANTADNTASLVPTLVQSSVTVESAVTLADAEPATRIATVNGYWITVGDLGRTIPADETGFWDDIVVAADGTISVINATDMYTGDEYTVRLPAGRTTSITDTGGTAAALSAEAVVHADPSTGLEYLVTEADAAALGWTPVMTEATLTEAILIDVLGIATINGSVTNIVSGLDEIQASVMGTVTAVDVPTVNFGNMATTVLGAVNTGEIGLGTNQVVEEALAGTTQAIRSEIQQIGTLSGLTQVALNSALNTMSINGSISNTLSGVNGSVAAISPDVLEIAMSASDTLSLTGVADLLGSMETTVLGAVNTGTIVSGVNNQVDGTVAGIVGNSATNMFGEVAP